MTRDHEELRTAAAAVIDTAVRTTRTSEVYKGAVLAEVPVTLLRNLLDKLKLDRDLDSVELLDTAHAAVFVKPTDLDEPDDLDDEARWERESMEDREAEIDGMSEQ